MKNDKVKETISFSDFEKENDYCKCNTPSSVTSDTESSDVGYWFVCCDCGKRLENEFHYYDHYDGEDHDDIELYS